MASSLVGVVSDFYARHGIRCGAVVAVAFSGGADSVALLAATRAAGHPCVALHCNFHLRGEESDRDEAFAREMADRLGCGIEVAHFDVPARCAATGESLEMACRGLRYEWFADRSRAAAGAWACVAVAHHADDNAETFFLNLLRGTGLKGLCGIPAVRDIFVRPLLDVSRRDIMAYLAENGLKHVVDSTNLSCDYRRNMLRNRILPCVKESFPAMEKTVAETMANLRRDSVLLQSLICGVASRFVGDDGSIDLMAVASHPSAATLLFHLLNRAGVGKYDFACAERMLRALGRSGAVFRPVSGQGSFLLDRGRLVPVADGSAGSCEAWGDAAFPLFGPGGEVSASLPLELDVELVGREKFLPRRDAGVVWLDFDAIPAGLMPVLRHWRPGDRMEPFGMRGSKLVSDILSDAKVPLTAKRGLWILVSGDKVLWIPGLRASRHYAVTNLTSRVLKVSYKTAVLHGVGCRNGDINKN